MHEAIVTKVKVQAHPDPEVHSLAVGYVFGETVIVSKDTKDEELGLYLPCELQISEEFAKANDLIRRKDEHGNTAGGMFEENRRVRIQKFRGVKSHGFWCPLSYLSTFGDTSVLKEGDKLTEFNGIPICQKYFPRRTASTRSKKVNEVNELKQKQSVWFPKHKDTEQLKYCLNDIRPGENIVVTLKVHGTSQRVAKSYDEKPEKWYDKVLSKFGIQTDRKFLRNYNGTRNVILKGDDNGYYSEHFRNKVAEKLYPYLEDHLSIYFEVVGWEGPNSLIMPKHHTAKSKDKNLQKQFGDEITYSYGCVEGTFDIYVYRIAYVLPNGKTIDLTWDEVKNKCNSWGVKHVPEIERFVFDGDYDKLIERIEAVSDGVDLIDKRHIREGVCVRCDGSHWKTYKNKGWTFRVLEGIAKENDDYEDMEEVS